MTLPTSFSTRPLMLQHTTTGGGGDGFDGTLPATTPVQSVSPSLTAGGGGGGLAGIAFPVSAKGGLFVFEHNTPLLVSQYHFDLGASVAYTLTTPFLDAAGLPDATKPELQVAAGTARFVFSVVPFYLLPGQALRMVAPLGGGAMKGIVIASAPLF